MKIKNPILSGFHPDPSILRVGDTYYIASSTFEWWPGVRIHMSKDLVHWKLIAHPLNEKRLLDMTGNPDSGGIWAPDLSNCAKAPLSRLTPAHPSSPFQGLPGLFCV